jgi:hypothetical protein
MVFRGGDLLAGRLSPPALVLAIGI